MKTLKDIMAAAKIPEGSRGTLSRRIKYKYEIKNRYVAQNGKRIKAFSDKDYEKILKLESVHKTYRSEGHSFNSQKRPNDNINVNRKRGLYLRITLYGGSVGE